jgi:APA family basic amino acid/polyamine antiporter
MYVYARRALGRYAGFVVGWNDWIATCGSCAAVAVVIAEYLGAAGGRRMMVAAALALGFALLQWRGVRAAGRAQEVTSLAKALLLLALAAACFILPAPPAPAAAPAAAGVLGAAAMVAALQAVIYTYDGWTGVVYFGGEVRDPGREIPRAMFGGVLAVTALYLLLNLAFLRVLPLHSLAGEALAAGAVARALFGALGDPVIRAVVVVGLLSSVHAFLLMAPRVLFAMARDGLVSERAAAVNAGGTPTGALIGSVLVVVLFIASGTFDDIIAVLAFFFVANYVVAFAAVFALRRREPDAERPYRAWGYPWTTGLALTGSLAFLIAAALGDTRNSVYALLLLAASYPAYRLSGRLMARG